MTANAKVILSQSTSTGKRNIKDETTHHKAAKKDKDFFHRIHKLKLYKERHAHLEVAYKEDLAIAGFCAE